MKFIKKIINKVKLKYYNFKLGICDVGREEAMLYGTLQEHDFWVRRHDMYLAKFMETKNKLIS